MTTGTDQTHFSVEFDDPPEKKVGRGRLWNLVIVAVLVAGVILSIAGAYVWKDYVQAEAKAAFDTNASNVSSAVSSSLRQDLDFVATERGGVVAVPDLSNHFLSTWYKSVDIQKRFPGAIGFGFVQLVPAVQLRQFGAAVVADPPINEPVTAPYTVFPSGRRAQYCLQRFGIAISSAAKVIPPTFDFCSATIPPGSNPSPIPALLEQATISGQSTVLNAGEIAKTGGLAGVFVVFSPVYTSATTPVSLAARQKDLRGWIVGTFNGPDLIRSNLLTDHGLAVTVLFDEIGPASTEISSVGTAPSGPVFIQILHFNADGPWIVRVVGSAHSSAVTQAMGVGILGVVMSALLFLLLLLLTRSRMMALRLVEKRTRQLRHQALYDSLTGLPSRALILDRAEKMLARSLRQPLSVGALFIDLDDFKEINDTFGHPVGDQLLIAVGARLSEEIRANDSVGRLAGDEFVVLAEGDVGGGGPEVVAARLLVAFSRPFNVQDAGVGPLNVSASIGVAVGYRNGAAELLRDADVALYRAKARGKHGYVVFDSQMRRIFSEDNGTDPDQTLTPTESKRVNEGEFALVSRAEVDRLE